MKPMVVYTRVAPFISLIFIIAALFVYNGYRNHVTNELIAKNTERIQHQNMVNNQKFCRMFSLIIEEGRHGPFRDAIISIYNDDAYQCEKVENHG